MDGAYRVGGDHSDGELPQRGPSRAGIQAKKQKHCDGFLVFGDGAREVRPGIKLSTSRPHLHQRAPDPFGQGSGKGKSSHYDADDEG